MKLYEEPIGILDKITKEAIPEMSKWQSMYLCGLIKEFKPKKILEVGVAAGGTTALILNTLDLIGNEAEVWSIDILEDFYAKPWLKTGFMAEEAKKIIGNNVNIKHNLRIGIVPDVIDEVGDGIDFLILDTVHMVPGEILDFPVCLPYLKDNAIVVLHDVILHATSIYINNYATQLLLDCITADKMPVFGVDNEIGYPNIAALRINNDTKKYIYDVFSAMLLPWQYKISDEEIDKYRQKYKELNYSEDCIKVFEKSVISNKTIIHNRIMNKIDKSKSIVDLYNLLYGKKVYIYGAGEVGNYVLNIIKDVIDFKGFVVSDDQQKAHNAYTLSELESLYNDDEIVYVAVAPEKMGAIMINLENSVIRNVKYMDIKLFSYIYEN